MPFGSGHHILVTTAVLNIQAFLVDPAGSRLSLKVNHICWKVHNLASQAITNYNWLQCLETNRKESS